MRYYDFPLDKLLADAILDSLVISDKPAKSNKATSSTTMPNIVDVIYNKPATIVFWDDGTKNGRKMWETRQIYGRAWLGHGDC